MGEGARVGRAAAWCGCDGAAAVCKAFRVWIGWIEFDVLLGDVHSLKEKRGVLRPVLAELRRVTEASVAEVGKQDLHRRGAIGVGVVAPDGGRVTEVLDRAERLVAAHPEFTLLSARRGIRRSDDD